MSPLLKKTKFSQLSTKQIVAFTLFLILFISALTFISSAASGGYYKPAGCPSDCSECPPNGYHYKNAIGHKAMEMADNIYGARLLNDIAENVRIKSSSYYPTLRNFVNDFYSYLQPVGYVLLVLYFTLELIEKTQMDNLNPEHFIKLMIKLLVGVVLINNFINTSSSNPDLLDKFIDLGDAISTRASSLYAESEPSLGIHNVLAAMENANVFTAMADWLAYFTPSLVLWICEMICKLIVFSRIIEFFARCAFAPVAMPNIYSGGINSSGYRYLKKIIALSLNGAMIIIIVCLLNTIQGRIEAYPNSFFDAGGQIIMGLATVMILFRSQTWANDIVGV